MKHRIVTVYKMISVVKKFLGVLIIFELIFIFSYFNEECLAKNEESIGKASISQIEKDQRLIEDVRKKYYDIEYEPIATLSQTVYHYYDGDSYKVSKKYGPINSIFIENDDLKRKNKVVLTFDCAYAGDYIIPILNVLDKYNIKASFFATLGFIKAHPKAVSEIIKRGHDFGGHSTNHLHFNDISDEEIMKEVIETEIYIKKRYGFDMCIFRNPYGEFNERNVKLVQEMGYYNVNWSFDSFDWKNESLEVILTNTLNHKFRQGDILLFHVSGIYTESALPTIIDYIRNKHLDFAPLSEMLYADNFIVENGIQKPIGNENKRAIKP